MFFFLFLATHVYFFLSSVGFSLRWWIFIAHRAKHRKNVFVFTIVNTSLSPTQFNIRRLYFIQFQDKRAKKKNKNNKKYNTTAKMLKCEKKHEFSSVKMQMQSLNIEAHINNCYNTITLLSRAGSYAQFMLQPITVKCVNFSKFIIFFKRILSPAFASNHCDRSDHAIIYTHTYTYLYNKWKVITNKKKLSRWITIENGEGEAMQKKAPHTQPIKKMK